MRILTGSQAALYKAKRPPHPTLRHMGVNVIRLSTGTSCNKLIFSDTSRLFCWLPRRHTGPCVSYFGGDAFIAEE
jgi:hypothetical protein